MQHSTLYTLVFAAAVCLACSVFVAGSAVTLRSLQERNVELDIQKNVLAVSGVAEAGAKLSAAQVEGYFGPDKDVRSRLVDLTTGDYAPDEAKLLEQYKSDKLLTDPTLRKVLDIPSMSREAPPNAARVLRLPQYALVYEVVKDGKIARVLLPVYGKGLWSTLRGMLALEPKADMIKGLTFYEQAETPGLGGEISNPKWQALWDGRTALDAQGKPIIRVVKGTATKDNEVDGLSGATLTSRGVTNLMQFWLGESGYGPYLAKLRQQGSNT